MSKTTKSEKWFGKKQKDLTKDELLEFWRLDEMHKKLLKKDREIEKYKRVYANTNNRLIEKEKQLAITEKALELAVEELDDAKDMLRDAGKNDWANTLDTSADYFKTKAKEMKSE